MVIGVFLITTFQDCSYFIRTTCFNSFTGYEKRAYDNPCIFCDNHFKRFRHMESRNYLLEVTLSSNQLLQSIYFCGNHFKHFSDMESLNYLLEVYCSFTYSYTHVFIYHNSIALRVLKLKNSAFLMCQICSTNLHVKCATQPISF